jgi:hypothetical protein
MHIIQLLSGACLGLGVFILLEEILMNYFDKN